MYPGFVDLSMEMKMKCELCGHDNHLSTEYGSTYNSSGKIYLCHTDDHSCYHRWTVHGERP